MVTSTKIPGQEEVFHQNRGVSLQTRVFHIRHIRVLQAFSCLFEKKSFL